jgi:hypothetical protein
MCLCYRRSPYIVTGTFLEGWTDVLASASCVSLEAVAARLSATSKGTSSGATATFSHRVAATSLLPFVRGAERCGAPGRHSDASSSLNHRTWRLKSTNASWACMTPGLRMDSSVILVTNTQVVNERRPTVSFTKASFRMGFPLRLSAGRTF